MSLLDVLEYRVADTDRIAFSLKDVPCGTQTTIYARPFGAAQWGYYSGPMYWDDAYKASHKPTDS